MAKIQTTKDKVYGHGITTKGYPTTLNNKTHPIYNRWTAMLQRCYDAKLQAKQPTYKGCKVHNTWKHYGNFYDWFEEQTKAYGTTPWFSLDVDKDLLDPTNRVYGPDTCVLIPKQLNIALKHIVIKATDTNIYPTGVHPISYKFNTGYKVKINKFGKQCYSERFDSAIEAYERYLQMKVDYVHELLNTYPGIKLTTQLHFLFSVNREYFYSEEQYQRAVNLPVLFANENKLDIKELRDPSWEVTHRVWHLDVDDINYLSWFRDVSKFSERYLKRTITTADCINYMIEVVDKLEGNLDLVQPDLTTKTSSSVFRHNIAYIDHVAKETSELNGFIINKDTILTTLIRTFREVYDDSSIN